MTETMRRILALALLLPLTAVAAVSAQDGFRPTSEYVFELDGSTDPGAEVFVQGQGAAFLIVSDSIESPLLVEPRAGDVKAVSLLKVARQADGTVNLLPNAVAASEGAFTVEMDGVTFDLDGHPAGLMVKPPWIGDAGIQDLLDYSLEYRRGAEDYTASEPILRELQAEDRPVTVRVFFGSWCPHCQMVMPRILKVAEALRGSKIALEFYGLPRGIGDDPEAKRWDIDGVPTGVVLIGDREVARISGGEWKIPELAIKNVLDGA
ncbi:MAG: thioredoxin family protein [Thermoanaerobaculia bacterium]